GIVTNVTNFGAFVDIGVHQDGLVHISALSHKFVDDPRKVVSPGDHVSVKVLKVDTVKNQISLTMKMDDAPEASAPRGERRPDNRGPRPQGGGRPGGPRGDRPQHGGGKPQGNPFNNPFAALMNVPTNKK